MKNRSSQPNGVENGLNMSQSVSNIKINNRKHILELYGWHKDPLQKIPSTPLFEKIPGPVNKFSIYIESLKEQQILQQMMKEQVHKDEPVENRRQETEIQVIKISLLEFYIHFNKRFWIFYWLELDKK